jgi:hypothetical protein
MKKIKYLFLVFATVCFIGLYGCKSTPKEEKAAEEVEAVEDVVEEAVEEVVLDTTEVLEEEGEVEAEVKEEEE